MKTKTDITKLNFNDLAFFKGISTSDAKWEMAHYFYSTQKELDDNLTKTGVPRIGINDYVDKSEFETKIKSVSKFEGLDSIDFIIDTYNATIPLDRIFKYAENTSFIKALKFTGKHSILNEILNKEQLGKLAKIWLLKNTYMVNYWSDKCNKFIQNNDWSVDFLDVNMISKEEIKKQLKRDD